MNKIELPGCTPEPLMNYLKALGVFRLVAEDREQGDPAARLSWSGGQAVLHTKFDRDSLVKFFLEDYRPTPIVAPWGGRSGFYPGSSESAAREALDSIVGAASGRERLRAFSAAIQSIRGILKRYGFDQKVRDDDKLALMRICRNELPDHLLQWLDAVFILTEDSRRFPPLLGTGGNEGSGSYVSTFAQVVRSLIVKREADSGILSALFAEGMSPVGGLAVGHFNPGAIGGANSSQGFDGGGGVNSWDYLLAIEGSLVFAGAVARRYGSDTQGRAAYPFCVEAVAVGYASESDKEAGESTRAEQWLPLWHTPTTLPEAIHLFSEGRAQLGRRQAKNTVEFSLALATLGTNAGINSFVRYAFVKRNGLSYFAAPLGRVPVTPRPKARLLEDPTLLNWLERLRSACRDKDKTPARYQTALRNIDRAMFQFANRSEQRNDDDANYLVEVLRALGRAERTLAKGLRFCQENRINPLAGLREDWLVQSDDGSAEFRLAMSLAGLRSENHGAIGSARMYLEEVTVNKYLQWQPGSTTAVWSNRSLPENLAAVFQRRQMEAFRAGLRGVPLSSSRFASLDDVTAFLNADVDDEKLHELLWGFLGVEYPRDAVFADRPTEEIAFEFGCPRLLVAEHRLGGNGRTWIISKDVAPNTLPDPTVFYHLASGRDTAIADCVDTAARRLKSSGLLVTGYRNRRQAGLPLKVKSTIPPERLLASMLFPLSDRDLEHIANAILNPPETEE